MSIIPILFGKDEHCKDFKIGTAELIWTIISCLLHVILIFIEIFLLIKSRLLCARKNKYEVIKLLIIFSFLIMSLCMKILTLILSYLIISFLK